MNVNVDIKRNWLQAFSYEFSEIFYSSSFVDVLLFSCVIIVNFEQASESLDFGRIAAELWM